MPLKLGTFKSISGSVFSDGTLKIGNTRVSAASMSASSAASLLKNAGCNALQIAGTLVAVYKSAVSDVTRYLSDLKFSLLDTAHAIWSMQKDLGVVAKNLYDNAGSAGKTSRASAHDDVANKASGSRMVNVFKAIDYNTPSSVRYVDVIRAMMGTGIVGNNATAAGQRLYQVTGSLSQTQ